MRVEDEEILREQTAVSNETAALIGDIPAAVQEVRQTANVAIRNERSSGRVRTQRRRSGNRRAIDDSGARNVHVEQHGIEQRRIPTAACDLECIQELVVENVHDIQRNAAPESGAFRPNIGHIQRQILGKLTLNSKIEILDIRRTAVRIVHGKRVVPASIDWYGAEHRELLRYGHYQVRQ